MYGQGQGLGSRIQGLGFRVESFGSGCQLQGLAYVTYATQSLGPGLGLQLMDQGFTLFRASGYYHCLQR